MPARDGSALRLAPHAAVPRVLLLVPLLLALPSPARAAGQACQAEIERVGYRYAQMLVRQIKACAAASQSDSISTCLAQPSRVAARETLRARWANDTATACAGVALGPNLGYLSTCAAAPSSCTFATSELDAPGPRNDLLDCLACRLDESLGGVGAELFADAPIRNACHQAIGGRGLGVVKKMLRMLKACQVERQVSIAACLSRPGNSAKRDRLLAGWRAASVDACATFDPFGGEPGYPQLCSGQAPAVVPACGTSAPPCTFGETTKLSDVAQSNDDLLDCTSCRAEESVLEVARDLYGANLCCVGDDCGVVRTRRACLRDGGEPALYRASTIPTPMVGPHAVAIDGDGVVYVADTGNYRILRITPQGQTTLVANTAFAPYDVSVDHATGELYVAERCSHQLLRLNPGGGTSVVAGTGDPGYAGDGGPATAARTAAPNKSSVDDEGNVFFTESGFVSLLCSRSALSGERIRKVAPDGTISTVAGDGTFSADGIGGPATEAGIGIATSVEASPDGAVLIGESGLNRVLRVEQDQTMTHVAGMPMAIVGAYAGDGGPATRSRIHSACGVAQGADGRVYVADMLGNRIRVVDREGSIVSIAGNGLTYQTLVEGQPGLLADAGCPEDVAVAPDGRVYFVSLTSGRVRVLTLERF